MSRRSVTPVITLTVKTTGLKKREVENLGHYEFMAYIGVPYFRWGGMDTTDKLASLCGVEKGKRVLLVGCGTGYSAFHLAKNYECEVVGVDISNFLITVAQEKVEEMGLGGLVSFEVGDAHDLQFDDGSFGVVLTESVVIFLDKERALLEFARVLRPGGFLGISEIYQADDAPEEVSNRIEEAARMLSENVGVEVTVPTPRQWIGHMSDAGLQSIQTEKQEIGLTSGDWAEVVGRAGVARVSLKAMYYLLRSKKIRGRLQRDKRVREMFMEDETTKKFFGPLLCVGTKPG
ncbi:MAG: methyltransferase domain-containing protein [Candidatus Thorarchaeota archaeon]|nr:MAG: methyltransferase domain-containing protein [Candidatus Thorarchaeota archaeon]